MFIVKSTEHGMQGRLLTFQEHPFEVQTNYAGAGALRCNFDVQDLRRVLPEKLWNLDQEVNPSLRTDENRSKEMGYMGFYEWDGESSVERGNDGSAREPTQWTDEKTREQWRQAFLDALQRDEADTDDKLFQCQHCGGPHHDTLTVTADEYVEHSCNCLKCECMRA